ncbi:MAG TPA: hypothetical protein EYQ86_01335 [Bacteroidetes bacterium]|nr:hypothetical protein [Bacteroidota bacterium]
MKNITVALLIILFNCCEYKEPLSNQEKGLFKTVKINEQTWMAENLNVFHFRNGDKIPYAITLNEWLKADEDKTPALCFYNNNEENVLKYGILYNWHAVNDPRGLAPKGWHIPSDSTFINLRKFLGRNARSMIKDSTEWNSYNDSIVCQKCTNWKNIDKTNTKVCDKCINKRKIKIDVSGKGSNQSGFTALPGGVRNFNGYFHAKGESAYWWSTTEYDSNNAWILSIGVNDNGKSIYKKRKGNGFSVRCLKE